MPPLAPEALIVEAALQLRRSYLSRRGSTPRPALEAERLVLAERVERLSEELETAQGALDQIPTESGFSGSVSGAVRRRPSTNAKIPIAAQLGESQTKSTWQTGAELGLRVRLRNGLKLEASYGVVGFLDAILLPTQIRIPDNQQEAAQGTSAIYNTQDYVLQGWRAGIGFQF